MGIFDNLFKKKEHKENENIKPYENSSQIQIGIIDEPETTEYKQNAIENEEDICIMFRDRIMQDRSPKHSFEIKHNSSEYTTLCYRSMDIVRVKWTEATKWLAIQMLTQEMTEKYKDDPRFAAQQKKTVIQWKTQCTGSEDLTDRYDIVLEAFDNAENYNPHGHKKEDEGYINAAVDAIAEVTGDRDHMYCHNRSDGFSICYYGSTGMEISVKRYKKKPNRFYCTYEEAKSQGLYTGKKKEFEGYVEFTDADWLRSLKPIMETRYENFNSWRDGYIRGAEASLTFLEKLEQ